MRWLSHDEQVTMGSRAASLWERLATHVPAPSDRPDSADPASLDPTDAVDSWVRAFSPGDEAAWRRRLAWDGIDAPSAARILSNDIETGSEPPTWVAWIGDALDACPRLLAAFDGGSLPELAPWTSGTEPPFAELLLPFSLTAREALATRDRSCELTGCLEVERALVQPLIVEFGVYASTAFYEAFDAFRCAPIDDDACDAQYRRFIRSSLSGGLAQILRAHPVLARHLAIVANTWVARMAECADRLAADRAQLSAAFGHGQPLGPLTGLEPALSDPHDGRRRVMALTFGCGVRLIYKPRSVGIERAFGDLLGWLHHRGLSPAQRVLRMVDRDDYGWVEFVTHDRFNTRDEVASYYRQAGGLLALTDVLGGADLHMENVVATRGGPALIDTEMLVQPRRRAPGPSTDEGDARADIAPRASCLDSGLLTLVEFGPDGDAFDIGGLRGTGTGPGQIRQRVFRCLHADNLAVGEDAVFRTRTDHLVVLHDVVERPESFRGEMLDGFAKTYEFLLAHRDALLSDEGPLAAFRGLPTRLLTRPSNQYAALAYVLARPRYQHDGRARSLGIETLARPFARSAARPAIWPVVVAERQAMESLDIPRFTVATEGTTILTGGEAVLEHGVLEAGLSVVRSRLRALSAADLHTQAWYLRLALSDTTESRFSTACSGALCEPEPDDAAAVDARLVAGAEWIGRELSTLADATDLVNWPRAMRPECRGTLGAHHLYDGTPGALLLFGALGRVTGMREWTERAIAAGARVRHEAEPVLAAVTADTTLGACVGVGSLAYAFAVLGRLLGDEACAAFARRCARSITPEHVTADRTFDVVRGSAGTVLSLLAAHAATSDPHLLELAACCGRHLLAAAVQTNDGPVWPSRGRRAYIGLAHGTMGVALALLRLSEATGEDTFRHAGARAVESVLRAQDSASGQWPLLHRTDGAREPARTMEAWCHGAPGIALGLAGAFDVLRDGALLGPLVEGLNAIARASAHPTEHLCCGNMGRAEALLTVGSLLGRPGPQDAARRIGLETLARAVRRGHVRLSPGGFEYSVFDPGFFRGLSGVGYQLLRLAAPSDLPSVLSFAW